MTPYFEHGADIGIIGRGATLAEAFEAAAAAMFALMTDLDAVRGETAVSISFDEPDQELALVTWLNQLLAQARLHHAIFNRFTLARNGVHWQGRAWGGPWRSDMDRGVEVKGATLTQLSVVGTGDGWEARCVVDV